MRNSHYEGRLAYSDGYDFFDNPYDPETQVDDHAAWDKGWWEAENEYLMVEPDKEMDDGE